MNKVITDYIHSFVEEYRDETIQLLRTLTEIPAPTGKEGRRAMFCQKWLLDQGAKNVTLDTAGNVVCPWNYSESEDLLVVSAHMDTVFPEREEIMVREERGRMYAPGIGDNTANLVNLLMSVKFLMKYSKCFETQDFKTGILFVANVGEEGLGNLKGSRAILREYQEHIRYWISLDLYYNSLYDRAVGSKRYRVKIRTEGGHSYKDFGNPNAIAQMASIIQEIYRQELPSGGTTTFNVGKISGGTTVNSIASEAEMLYEVRSDLNDNLRQMDEAFGAMIERHCGNGENIQVEVLGIRPGNGEVDREKQKKLKDCCLAAIKTYYNGEISIRSASTDCNIPLSVGIPAVNMGTVIGDQLHTREEWIEKETMVSGQKMAICAILQAANLE